MNYAQIRENDVANGPGVRVSLFVSGCTHNCYDCFNKAYQDFTYGDTWGDAETEYLLELLGKPRVSGLSLLGGEPFQNARGLIPVVREVKREYPDKSIWVWSGYTYEELQRDSEMVELLKEVDVLIDGKFDYKKKDLSLVFRGSSNQRVINVADSLRLDRVVLVDEYMK